MKKWFSNLKVSQKLALISIFFVLPDSVMLYLFITAINDSITFARMEAKGNQYQRPLEELLELIPEHRQLAQRVGSGDTGARVAMSRKAAQIDAAFYELAHVDAQIGVDLQFTNEGLAKRHRENYRVQTVRADWQQLRDQATKLSADESARRHLDLIAAIRTMITHAGDTSNLILDPDLDSYYLMDTTLLALPQTQDRMAAVMADGEKALEQPYVTPQDRQQFAIYANLLQEADLDRVVSSVKTALLEDPNFYGVSPTLQQRVPPALEEYIEATERFIKLTKRFVYLDKVDVTAEEYFEAGTKARAASFNLWRIADEEVDTLLHLRIESYQHRRARSLLVAGCALLAAVGFVTFITRSISGPLTQQAAALRKANDTLQDEIAERRRAEEELRHSEALLAAAQRIAQIGSWEWDIETNKMIWSEENCHIHGLDPKDDELSYMRSMEFIPADERALCDATFKKALTDQKPFSFVHRIVRNDGESRITHQRGDVIVTAGKVTGMFGTTQDITERKLAEEELAKMHKNLLEVSRQAGMAEVATGVLHNVGNVLNSVNVSAMLISDRLSKSRVAHLSNVSATLKANSGDLAKFLTANPKGKKLPSFIESLAERLTVEQKEVMTEVEGLAKNIAHIKEIVAMQQNYAKISGVIEPLSAAELVEDALELNSAAFERHKIELVREFANVPPVLVDKHKVLQILINVIRNAKYAVSETSRREKTVIVKVVTHGVNGQRRVQISVCDNGVGIAAENLARIFAHGFTTKRDGHGFGLHSSALAAKEMGGSLVAQSDGPDKGATFTLELPIDPHADV
ncbi:MAG TPA: ATP-binding protein [Chthoniobacter sp.]|nr:ATP-binding protein [Chthoniobacter sp.]